jgi:YD repeat-containing protein
MTLYRTPLMADNAFAYNGVDNAKAFTSPLGSTTSYAYNAERQLSQITLPSGKAIVNTYASGRLTETSTPEWTNTFAYACGDLLGSISRGSEKLAYTYDGELITGIEESGTLTATLGFTYNSDFRPSSLSYGGTTEELGYDKDGLLARTAASLSGIRKGPLYPA